MIRLQRASEEHRDLLWNINQKYLYEMTAFYDDIMDKNGNYHYGYFEDYFTDPKRTAYLIYNVQLDSDEVLIGFAFLCPYSNIGKNPDYTMAEFTIFPVYRKNHFALEAAKLILEKHPGKWEIKYNERNQAAKKLWKAVAASYETEVYQLNEEETVLLFDVTPYAFIWDLDGTLVDSYPVIVNAARENCARYGFDFSDQYIYDYVTRYSVRQLVREIAAEINGDLDSMMKQFDQLNDSRIDSIMAMPHAEETIKKLTESGHRCFVFTHRGSSCQAILERTGLISYFTEIVTAMDGFPRKPAPDGIEFLMNKYELAPDKSFYVGDRSLDIEAAVNAGIGSIFYDSKRRAVDVCHQEGSRVKEATYIVHDLLDIPGIVP